MDKIKLNRLYDDKGTPSDGQFCVYTLYNGDKPVYVGQTKNLQKRLHDHAMSDKEFSSFEFVVCDKDKMNITEADLIVKLNPPMNTNLPRTDKYFSVSQLKDEIYNIVTSVIHNAPVVLYREKSGTTRNHYFDRSTVDRIERGIRDSLIGGSNDFSVECMVDNLTSVVGISCSSIIFYDGKTISCHDSKEEAHAAEVEFIRSKVREIKEFKKPSHPKHEMLVNKIDELENKNASN